MFINSVILSHGNLLSYKVVYRRLRNAKHRINTVFFVVKIKYLLKVYGKIELTRN